VSEREGDPQGAVTGRYELASNIGKPKAKREWKRWSDVPLWYRVLDRFGLPTLFVLMLAYAIWSMANNVITRWDAQQRDLTGALRQNTDATVKLTDRIEVLADDTHSVLTIVLDRTGRMDFPKSPQEKHPAPKKVP
jgi:hypothetical protein